MGRDDDTNMPPLDDEERAFRASLEKLVDWVRVEPRHMFLRAFGPALLLVPCGGLLVAATFSRQQVPPQLTGLVLLAGLLLITLGPVWALFSLIRAMGRDAYVAIRVDGLGLRLVPSEPETVVPWEAIEDVRAEDEPPSVVLCLGTGERLPLRGPFAGVGQEDLARRIRDARRLAVWNVLTPERLRVQR